MASVELSVEQLRDAIIQLPDQQRRKLLQDLEHISTAEAARAAARQIRGTFRMNARQRKRMAALLGKGNEGTLTAEESRELGVLVDQFERKTLEMALALVRPNRSS